MRYENVYPFNVIEELRRGKEVFALDRQRSEFGTGLTVSCKDMSVYDLLSVIADAEADKSGRYLFWKEVE